MSWAYQVYIMAALCLERKHHPGQFSAVNLTAIAQLANIVILAKDTAQVTVGKKDSPRAMPTYQRRLFAKVRPIAGNHCLMGNTALTTFASEAINPTMTRAQAAFGEH